MACYHPITAWRANHGGVYAKTGKVPVVFKKEYGGPATEMQVPCGQCIGCRLERSRQWAIRCVHEASLHPINCFITLSYDDAHIDRIMQPLVKKDTGEVFGTGLGLNKQDYVLFMKRLRKKFGDGIRFFHCGEYGQCCSNCGLSHVYCKCGKFNPTLGRPHHHAILFGHDFADKKVWKTNNGSVLYRSEMLEKLWTYGYSSVGNVTFESAAYVARYVTKKITGEMSDDYYLTREPEYITMSRRPGLARGWYEKFKDTDVYPQDYVVLRNAKLRPPRYYDKLFDLDNPAGFSEIREKRILKAKQSVDNTPDRLAVREGVQIAKANMLIRKMY